MQRHDSVPFHHAWITLDGKTAIDVTLVQPENFLYFGIAVPAPTFFKMVATRVNRDRTFKPLFSSPIDGTVIKVLGAL